MPSANNPLSVRAFVESVFRHKKKLLAFNVLMLALTVAISNVLATPVSQ